MARIRSLKPEILQDKRTAELSDPAFRLFVAMICMADDFGNIRADERFLSAQVWWARGPVRGVTEVLAELAESDLVLIYQVRDQTYAHLRSWEKHQRIDNRGATGKVPGPKDAEAQPVTVPVTGSRGGLSDDHTSPPLDRIGEERMGMSGKPDTHPADSSEADHLDPVALFAEAAVFEINRWSKKAYRPDGSLTVKLCRALVRAKHTPDEARAVIESKRSWLSDDKMREYFRPATLLALSKFESYLDDLMAKRRPIATQAAATADDTFELPDLPWVPAKAAS